MEKIAIIAHTEYNSASKIKGFLKVPSCKSFWWWESACCLPTGLMSVSFPTPRLSTHYSPSRGGVTSKLAIPAIFSLILQLKCKEIQYRKGGSQLLHKRLCLLKSLVIKCRQLCDGFDPCISSSSATSQQVCRILKLMLRKLLNSVTSFFILKVRSLYLI